MGATTIPASISSKTRYVVTLTSGTTWTVPTGATIVSGQGTRTITVNFLSTLTATYTGTITVVGKNDCGNTSAASTRTLTKVTLGTPGVISGPTAVGKTSVAVDIASHFGTEIISADSRQCYKELNIGVAKPDESDAATPGIVSSRFTVYVPAFTEIDAI
jgi:hypothetical protein